MTIFDMNKSVGDGFAKDSSIFKSLILLWHEE